ncbi:hypothetical protein [Martelella sp. AD-3]|uniref:hypothetical protein n=1 Tax=Martelella sp. AD-3 TaxID=686597 RepID=UPI000B2554AC|nr:hypothetical protein [Martelella sp. AD-3]
MSKARGKKLYPAKTWAGWNDFRYGTKSRRRNAPAKRLLNKDKREHVISRLMERLDDFRLTKFEHEADCRHGIRSGLCLEGYSWGRADHEAALLVDEALKRLGAVRPKWEEGQRHYFAGREYCSWCYSKMGDGAIGRFCSAECARSLLNCVGQSHQIQSEVTVKSAMDLIHRATLVARECEECGAKFQPQHKNSDQKYCSKRCYYAAMRDVGQANCPQCGVSFLQTRKDQKFCSKKCSKRFEIKIYETSLPEKCCPDCGVTFKPKRPWQSYCGDRCTKRASARRMRALKKASANPNIIRLPRPEADPISSELFDSWFQAA